MVQTPGAARAEAKRAEILRKAAAVFGRKGFHKAGMRDIARGLGMAPGALYYYFESKDDLLIKLYNLSDDNVSHIKTEIEQRRDAMMQRLYLYERIRRAHYDDPESLPVRRQGVYLALLGGIRNGEQYLQWCDEALKVLARVENASGDS